MDGRETTASFLRFVVAGGGLGLLSSGALLMSAGAVPVAAANAVVTVVSTLLANELHSRFTFRRGAAGLRTHLESTGTAVAAYLVTTGALLGLDLIAPDAGALTQQAVYLTASGVAGIGRFVALKLLVFAQRRPGLDLRTAPTRPAHAHTREHLVPAA